MKHCFLHMIITMKTETNNMKQITGMAVPYYVHILITKIYFYYYTQYYHVNKNFCAQEKHQIIRKKMFSHKKIKSPN